MGDMADMCTCNGVCEDDPFGDPFGDSHDIAYAGYNRGRSYIKKGPYRRNCRYCGCRGLVWRERGGKWRLVDMKTREVHSCKEYKKKEIDDFNDTK